MVALKVSVRTGSASGWQMTSARFKKSGSCVVMPMLSPAQADSTCVGNFSTVFIVVVCLPGRISTSCPVCNRPASTRPADGQEQGFILGGLSVFHSVETFKESRALVPA